MSADLFWVWESTITRDAAVIYGLPALEQFEGKFDSGTFFGGTPPLIGLDLHAEGIFTDVLPARGSGLLFSPRLRLVLESASVDNIQYLPVVLRNLTLKTERTDYRMANVIGRVSSVDRENSTLEMSDTDPDIIAYIDRLEIDSRKARGLDLFRLHEDPEILIASDRVKKACEGGQITGVRFHKPSDY